MTDLIQKLTAAQAFDPRFTRGDTRLAHEEAARRAPLDCALRECVAALVECDANGHHSICKGNPANARTTSAVWNDAICDCGFILGRKALAALEKELERMK